MSETSRIRDNSPGLIARTLYQSFRALLIDNGTTWSASIAYYSLLSTFPMLLLFASLASFVVNPDWVINQATELLTRMLPQGGAQVAEIVKDAVNSHATFSIFSLGLWMWSGSRVFAMINKALNVAYDVDENLNFYRRTLKELAMLFSVGLMFILAVASRWLLRELVFQLQWVSGDSLPVPVSLLLDLLSTALLGLSFFLIYRLVPRRRVGSRAATAGAAVATGLFLVARPLFTGYLYSFASYNLVYGSLAMLVVLIIWAYILSMILLYGGEVAAHSQEILLDGHPVAEMEERHAQRSPN